MCRKKEEHGGVPNHWIIDHREHGLIGSISVFFKCGIDGHCDEMGYAIGASWRGRGYATGALRALTAVQFETRPKLVRLEAWVYAHNLVSVRVLEKAGYRKEGFCRSVFLKDGRLLDAWLLARLRSDEP